METLLGTWLVVFVVGWIGFLLAFPLLWRLHDGGYAAGRILGWSVWALLTGWPWALGVWSFTQASTTVTLLALAALAAWSAYGERARLGPFLAGRFRTVLGIEAVFALAYFGFAFLVSHYPDIHPRSLERFQDFSLLQAVATSRTFPVEDPWFAGEPLVYYFFGHFMVAQVELLLAADPWSFFNPAVAAVQALLVVGAFGLGLDLTRRRSGGLLCAYLTALCGTCWVLLRAAWCSPWRPIDWFGPCRAIPGAMTEFPAFNILCADLHAHVIGFPLFILSGTLVLAALLGPDDAHEAPRERRFESWGLLFLGTCVVGVEFATNSLDGFAAAALWTWGLLLRHHKGPPSGRWIRTGLSIALIVVGGIMVAHPFAGQLFRQGRGVTFLTARSPVLPFLVHFGIPLGLLAIGLVPLARRLPRLDLMIAFAVVLFAHCSDLFAHTQVLVLASLVVTAAILGRVLALASRPPADAGLVWGLVAALLAILLLAVCEIAYVPATHGALDLGRAVTTNKLYLQAWLLLGGANTVLLARLAPGSWRRWATPPLLLLLALGMLYPLLGTLARAQFFLGPRTLWAGGFVQRTQPGVFEAVEWFKARGPGRPVILEATGQSYTWQSRLGTLTGGVSTLGWSEHQGGWRNSWMVITERRLLVDDLYRGRMSPAEAEATMDRLRVEFIAVGSLEREKYPGPAISALVASCQKVFDVGGLALYRRRPGVTTADGATSSPPR